MLCGLAVQASPQCWSPALAASMQVQVSYTLMRSCRGLGLCKGKIVLIESIARVKSLSLSGKILYRLHMADALLVQWSELQRLYPRTVHRGRLY